MAQGGMGTMPQQGGQAGGVGAPQPPTQNSFQGVANYFQGLRQQNPMVAQQIQQRQLYDQQQYAQPQMSQQSVQPMSNQQTPGGYDPRMFGAPYTPPPPPAPAPAPAPRFPFFGAQRGGQQYGQSPFMSLYQQRQQQVTQPAPPLQPSMAPGGSEPLYQTPQTPAQGMRPSSQAPQFYQPIYRPQYQDYNMGNPYGVSMYGQSPFMGGFNPYGGMGRGMGFNPYGGYGQSPFMGGMSAPQPTQSDLYAQRMMMQSGGQGYGMGQRSLDANAPENIASQLAYANQQRMGGYDQQAQQAQQALMARRAAGQIPGGMQSAFSQMLQQQQAGRGGALPTASQSDINQQHFLAQQQAGPQGLVAGPMETLRIQANQARRAQMSPDQLAAEDAQAAQQSQQSMSALQNLFAGKPVGGQSGMTSALGSLAGGLPMGAAMKQGGIVSLIKK